MKTIKAAVANVLRRVDRMRGLGPTKPKDPKKLDPVTKESVARVAAKGTKARPARSYRANRNYHDRPSKRKRLMGFRHEYDRETAKSVVRARMRKYQGRWDGKGDPGIAASLRAQAV